MCVIRFRSGRSGVCSVVVLVIWVALEGVASSAYIYIHARARTSGCVGEGDEGVSAGGGISRPWPGGGTEYISPDRSIDRLSPAQAGDICGCLKIPLSLRPPRNGIFFATVGTNGSSG